MNPIFIYILISCLSINILFGQNTTVTKLKIQDNYIVEYYNFQKLKQSVDSLNKGYQKEVYYKFNQATHSAQRMVDSIMGEITFEFNNQQYDAIIVNPRKQEIKMHWLTIKKTPYKSLGLVKKELEKRGDSILMLTNGGMYLKNNHPQGLFISKSEELIPLDSNNNAYGNFYMKPNGVFYIKKNEANVTTTNNFNKIYSEEKNIICYATQSGPMLVINGKIHDKFMHQSNNLHLRSGVGIMTNGNIVFIISQSNKTNFHDFGSIFKDVFGCKNALYLDGAISKMYLPKLRPHDLSGNFGVIISVTE